MRKTKIMNVADGPGFSRYDVIMLVARLSFVTAIGFFSMKWIMGQLDPNNKQKRKAKQKVSFFTLPMIASVCREQHNLGFKFFLSKKMLFFSKFDTLVIFL